MAILNRLTRLFRADLHAVLDRLEEPDVLLRQALREMEDEVAQRTQQHRRRDLQGEQIAQRLRELESQQQRLAGELDLAFAASNETLVRTLLRRRIESERLQQQLAQRHAELLKRNAELAAVLEEQRRRLDELRQRAAVYELEPVEPVEPVSAGVPAPGNDAWSVPEADVELALLRERQRRSVP